MKCPKCGVGPSPKNIIGDENTPYVCRNCNTGWTQWQQDRIAFLQGLLKEIEDLLNSDDKWRLEPPSAHYWVGYFDATKAAARIASKAHKKISPDEA